MTDKTSESGTVRVDIAPGELMDKITILQIKQKRIQDPAKLRNVAIELSLLSDARKRFVQQSSELDNLADSLHDVNGQLWDIEDKIRICERDKEFGPRFIELARSVYHTNDRRAALKRQINELLGSVILEEKDYEDYE